MHHSTLTPLYGAALFTPADFCEINQLADLLFNDEEHSICLISEHEAVTRAWITSALHNSHLAKKVAYPVFVYTVPSDAGKTALPDNAWAYLDDGKLIRTSWLNKKTTTLRFPALSIQQRIALLHQLCIDELHTHVLTIPLHTVKKALEWQSRYCADKQLLAETLLLLRRAVNRFLLTHVDDKQTAVLEPKHIAEILADWQHATLTEDTTELKSFLTENIIGQTLAIEQFVQAKSDSSLFILAGKPYSGKKTFIEHYTQFTHGAKSFCISFNLSFFTSDSPWTSIYLPIPNHNQHQARLNLLEIVEQYPYAIIMLTHADENLILLERLQRQIKRSFFQVDGQCISIENITWMLLLDTEAPEETPMVAQESLFSHPAPLDLSDILYRPTIGPLSSFDEPVTWNENYALEAVQKQFSEAIVASACILPFFPLTEKDQKNIINKEIKRIIQQLKKTHDVPIYYQEEVIHFLLAQVAQANKGFEALHQNLHHQIEHVFLKSLEQGEVTNGQVLMLQLNDTGRVLQMVRTVVRSGTTQVKLKI